MNKIDITSVNLCNEIVLDYTYTLMKPLEYITVTLILKPMTNPKYKFSREWYVATYNYNYYHEVFEWCTKHFGPHSSCPDAWSRWVHKYEDQIKFRDAQDYEWFVLRWS